MKFARMRPRRILRSLRRRLGSGAATPAATPLKTVRTSSLTYHATATGNYWLPTDAHQDVIARAIRTNRIYDPEIVDLAGHYITAGTAVLDVGANFGQMSVLFSNLAGDGGKVYAFEADDFVFEVLEKNIVANDKEGKIIPTFGAVHNVANETLIFPVQDFEEFGTYGSYGIDYNADTGRSVNSITIDGLGIAEPVSFMKVDIQGGDLQGMQGAVKTIQRNRMPILFEYEYQFEERFGMSFQSYVEFVRDIDYVFKRVVNGHNFLIVPR
jgi:FkbM family methyltransferase